jgi:hypothetical protein
VRACITMLFKAQIAKQPALESNQNDLQAECA